MGRFKSAVRIHSHSCTAILRIGLCQLEHRREPLSSAAKRLQDILHEREGGLRHSSKTQSSTDDDRSATYSSTGYIALPYATARHGRCRSMRHHEEKKNSAALLYSHFFDYSSNIVNVCPSCSQVSIGSILRKVYYDMCTLLFPPWGVSALLPRA